MKTTVQSTGEAMPKPPSDSDILADFSRLLTLVDITFDLVECISDENVSPALSGTIRNAKNMMSVLGDNMHRFDQDLEACMAQIRF